MILFVGCSYTWGSGLQYEYLHNEKGWSIDKINQYLPDTFNLENLDYESDEYRKQHGFPNLVAKELNKSYVIGTYGNGGSNCTTIDNCLNYSHKALRAHSVSTIVVQFSDWLRDCGDVDIQKYPGDKTEITTQDYIDNEITKQINRINNLCNSLIDTQDSNFKEKNSFIHNYPKWVGLSWRSDLGKILKKLYPETFIPIYHNGQEYDSFDYIYQQGLRLCDNMPGVKDTHLNSEGCKVIANSIVRKLKTYE